MEFNTVGNPWNANGGTDYVDPAVLERRLTLVNRAAILNERARLSGIEWDPCHDLIIGTSAAQEDQFRADTELLASEMAQVGLDLSEVLYDIDVGNIQADTSATPEPLAIEPSPPSEPTPPPDLEVW